MSNIIFDESIGEFRFKTNADKQWADAVVKAAS